MLVSEAMPARHHRSASRRSARTESTREAPRHEVSVAGFGTYALAVAVVVAALCFHVFLRVGSLRLGYSLADARQSQLQLVHDNRALKTEIGTLTAPARLRALASERFGMVPAERFVDLSGEAK